MREYLRSFIVCFFVRHVVWSGQVFMGYFGQDIDLIIDGGETAGGTGSTILDVTVEPPRILRDGMIPRRALKIIIQDISASPSPGLL